MATVPPRQEHNSIRMLQQPDTWPMRPMYEYLIGLDPETGQPVPQLATEWSLEPDGLSFRFKLRRGVPFHGGFGEFTAKDVVFTWQDVIKQDSFASNAPYWRGVLKDVEIVNDYEVIFRLTRPDGTFLDLVSESESGFEIRSKAHADTIGEPTLQTVPLAGTGPYQFKERTQSQYLRYEHVPYQHWRSTPDFPEFEFRFRAESSTRYAALQAGEVHMASLPEDSLQQAQGRGFKVLKGKVAGLRTFLSMGCCYMNDPKDPSQGWKYPDSPLMDVRVRKALDKSINRDEMNKAFFANKGELMYVDHFHPSRMGWDPMFEQRFPEEYGYDPAKARSLLAEAGYGPSKPLTTNILVQPLPFYSGAEDVADAIGGYFRAIGVTPEMVSMDSGEIRNQARQFRFNNHYEVRGTSASLMSGMIGYHWGSGPRGSGIEDPELDAAVNQITNTLNPKDQDGLWRKVATVTFEKHLAMPLYWLPAEIVVDPTIVSDYVFPGSISGTWTHMQNIKAAGS
jgi:peptide/nickel transport system substrate-binding protein